MPFYFSIISEPAKQIIKSTTGEHLFLILFCLFKISILQRFYSQIHEHSFMLSLIECAVQLNISFQPPRLFCWVRAAVHISIELLLCSPSKKPGKHFNGHAHSLPLHLAHNEVNYMSLRPRPFVTRKLFFGSQIGPCPSDLCLPFSLIGH